MQKIIKVFRQAIIVLMCFLTAANVITITVQVLLRYFLKYSISWCSELAGISLVWITFLGATLATLDETNINFNNFIEKAAPLPKLILKLLCKIAVACVVYVMVYYGYKTTIANINTMLVSIPVNLGVAFCVVPISGVLMAISIVINAVRDIKEYKGHNVTRGDAAIYDDVPEEVMEKANAALAEGVEEKEGNDK